MRTVAIDDVRCPEAIQDGYMTCKYIERKGIPIDEVTLGNVHDIIEELTDDHQLPIVQVLIDNSIVNEPDTIEGYLIGA